LKKEILNNKIDELTFIINQAPSGKELNKIEEALAIKGAKLAQAEN